MSTPGRGFPHWLQNRAPFALVVPHTTHFMSALPPVFNCHRLSDARLLDGARPTMLNTTLLTPQNFYSINFDAQCSYETFAALDACYVASWQLP
jgi:hypothetical protein